MTDAGYSETDIWKMLGGGIVQGEGSGTSWDAGAPRRTRRQLHRAGAQLPDGGVTIELGYRRDASELAGREITGTRR